MVVRVALLQNAIAQRNVVNTLIVIIPSNVSIPTSPDAVGGKKEEKPCEKTLESKLLHSLRFLVTFKCSRKYSNAVKQIIWSTPHRIAAYWRGE